MTDLKPREQTERFLLWAYPEGPWVLTAIPVEGGRTTTETFIDMRAALQWVERFDGRQNLYWTVNRVRGAVLSKPSKEEIDEVVMLHTDLDPRRGEDPARERERILTVVEQFSPSPSAIIDSGGGVQCFWRLDDPFYVGGDANRIADIEAYNRGLAAALGGDHCHNVDRLMRLPGTMNLPDEKKRKGGRVARLAQIVELSGATHPLHDFTAAPAEKGRASSAASVALPADLPPADLDALPDGVSQRTRMLIVQGDDPDDPTRYKSKSEVMWAVTCELIRAGCGDQAVASILLDPDLGISDHPLRQKRSREYVARQIEKAREEVGRVRPRVVYSESELPGVLDEAEAALIASGIPIYQMNGRLVQPVRLDGGGADEHGVRRAAGALVINEVRDHRLLEHMLGAARFVKVSRNEKDEAVEKPFAPPLKFAKHYAERVGAWRLPVLEGISTIPTMRGDGSIVSADGYDAASRLLIDTQGVVFPSVPDQPTWADARAALDALIAPICEFPFVQDGEDRDPCGDAPSASRSAALAMMLTAVVRKSLRSAPIFGLSAPTMETGKSLLADIPAWMVTGREAAMMSQGASEEEDQKGLLSILMSGDPVNVIDNISREVAGDALCTILTKETWRQRGLGANRMVTVSTKALFIANGNNLVFREDMATRAVMVSLDAQMERPGERVFRIDLKDFVPRHRGELVAAALTVLRAYFVAGRPRPADMKPSRFTDWDDMRGALLWLDEPDPYTTQARVTAGDSARAELVGLMSALRDAFGSGEFVSPRDILARADDEDRSEQRPAGLSLALSAACSGRSGVSAVGLGKYLKGKADRRHEGMWIKARADPKNGNRYAVMVEAPKPDQPPML